MTVKLKITTKGTLKMLELGKLDAPRVQTGQSLSEYQGFRTRTHLLHGHFNVF